MRSFSTPICLCILLVVAMGCTISVGNAVEEGNANVPYEGEMLIDGLLTAESQRRWREPKNQPEMRFPRPIYSPHVPPTPPTPPPTQSSPSNLKPRR
ncbi:unnamed protein product [Hydatigera taeniaeformis]|uniref:Leguminosin group485 secreted peptide n=1 Tax=Hydatigena taeniaeformis TaxID=6205 RepID=A0A0R3XBG4_HYDTA|nr:unnamed protein product [Hydatigera taeniaeformis]